MAFAVDLNVLSHGNSMKPFVKAEEIGRKIRVFRQNAKLSQEKLAELVGVTPQQLQKYEAGKTKVSTDKLQLIAIALQIEVTEFFNDRTAELTLNETEIEFVMKLRKLKNGELQKSV